jgi:hypothetical protein
MGWLLQVAPPANEDQPDGNECHHLLHDVLLHQPRMKRREKTATTGRE